MATIAYFTVVDYDGKTHEYYRFADGYPKDDAGVFANFPLGDHDFCLETFDWNYLTDVYYDRYTGRW